MAGKISEYTNAVATFANGDLVDVSKRISTSPDVFQSQKLEFTQFQAFIQANASNILNTNGLTLGGNFSHNLNSNTLTFTNGNINLDGKFAISATDEGILLPRLTTAEKIAISGPDLNLVVFDTTLNSLQRWNGSAWVALASGFGLISISDANGEPTFFSDLQSALTATLNIDTINIHSDIELISAVTIPVRLDLTINMNGNRIFGDTTSGDFNLFEVATDAAFGARKLTLLNGGTIETIGTAASLTAACPFSAAGSFKITNYELGTTTIRSENADCFRVQTSFVRGGNLIAENGSCFFTGEISFTKLTLKNDITGNWSKIYKSDIYTSYSGITVGNGQKFINNTISGIVTGLNSNYGLIKCYNTSIIQNNYIEALTGSTLSALYLRSSSGTNQDHQFINNNIVINRGSNFAGKINVAGNLYNNYFYAENQSAVSLLTSTKSFVNNICITNSATHSGIFDYGTTIITDNQVICVNPSHTGEPISVGTGSKVYNNVLICNNAATNHIVLRGNAKIANNTMSETGAGIDLDGNTNAQTNSADSAGNLQIG